jgi:hypothetical protein
VTDLSTLRIDQPGQVVSAIKALISGQATDWFNKNSSAVEGDLQTLAQAAAKTTAALVEGRIDAATAKIAYANQRAVLVQTPAFVEYMAATLAQSLLDGVFNILGAAINNRLGFTLIPPAGGTPAPG